MKNRLNSVFVSDQDKTLKFYTEVLGFVRKNDFPFGQFRWLTVVSPDEPNGTELVLEPDENPASKTFKKSVFEQGIPITAFQVDNIEEEYARLKKLGVIFKKPPTDMGPVTMAMFDHTCGNYIQIYHV